MTQSSLIYLASPYSDPSPLVRHTRFLEACAAAAHLFQRGHFVFSPIAHTHPIKELGGLDPGWEFWQHYDILMIEKCDELIVLQLPGFLNSRGVAAEITLAEQNRIPIHYMRKDGESYIIDTAIVI